MISKRGFLVPTLESLDECLWQGVEGVSQLGEHGDGGERDRRREVLTSDEGVMLGKLAYNK